LLHSIPDELMLGPRCDRPSQIAVNVAAWPGHLDIEIDCIAAVRY